MLTRLSRVSFWCAAIAAGLALAGPPALAALLTTLSVAAGMAAFVTWRLALRERAGDTADSGLPTAQPLASASLIDTAARVVACCAAAPTLDAALFGVAAVLKGELGAHAVPVYRVRAVDAVQATLVEALAGKIGSSTVQRLVRLDDMPLGQAVATRRVAGAPGQPWAVPVERDGRCDALLLVDGMAMQADAAALASLLDLARTQLCQRAQHEPRPHAPDAGATTHRVFSDTLDESLFVSNPDRSQFDFLAGSAFDIWGMTPEQHAQRADVFLDNVVPEDRPLLRERRAAELRQEDTDIHLRINHPRKGLRWLRSRTHTRAQPDGGLRVYGRVSDVTDDHLRMQALERARDAAQAASRAKSEVLASMSHEVRTPMNGVLGMAELLLATRLDDTQRRYAQAVVRSGEALLAIIDAILDFSKIEAGQLALVHTDFRLHDLVRDTLERLGPRAREHDLDLRLLESADLPALVRGDPQRLRQVLTDLLTHVVARTQGGAVVVEIRRGGAHGDPAAVLDFSLRASGTVVPPRQGGSGLGLAMARHLVALMGGHVDGPELQGGHAEVRFGLPLPLPLPLAGPAHAGAGAAAEAAAGGPRSVPTLAGVRLRGQVLVVEDNTVNQEVIGQMLRACGCEVRMACGAVEGLQALCEARFDLVLMDIHMPGMDGVEALGWFRRGPSSAYPFVTPARTPVIAVTANVQGGDEDRFLELGFDDCLSKPLRLQQLHAMLTRRLQPLASTGPDDGPAPGAAPPAGPAHVPGDSLLDADALARLRELDPKGENQLMERVLKAFETSVARLMPQLEAARVSGDLPGIRHVAHTLKSSSASIGALRLSQWCAEIESQVRQERTEDLDAKVLAMASEVEIVLKALRQLMDPRP